MENRLSDILDKQIDIFSIVKDVLRQWWVILLMSVSVALFTELWVNMTYEPEYTVRSTFVVTTKKINRDLYQDLNTAKEMAEQFSYILESNILKRKVAEDLGLEKFTAATTVNVLSETNLMELTVTSGSAMESYRVLRSIMNNYNSVSDYVIENVILEVIQPPTIPDGPSNSLNTRESMKQAFLIAAAVMTALFALLSYSKDTVKNEREVSKKIDAKFLGSICHETKVKSLRSLKNAKSASLLIRNPMCTFRFVESNKNVASRIRNQMNRNGFKTLLVTSVMENEGKSTVAANVALALAQENKNVLLMDCDFRKPAQYKIFSADKDDIVNFPEILEKKKGLGNLVKRQEKTSLYTVFNSTPSAGMEQLLETGTLQIILDFFRQKMDYIILDASPMGLVSDAEELAYLVDATLLVVRQDRVLASDINDTIDVLNRSRGKVLGCVFNDVVTGLAERIGSYGYGDGYRYGGRYGKQAK
ncbi:MAG: polysaccharide biosynthesis tyrosine autokinase [Lachnospiraceae bacterium]|nr:polysaccharide biosynthesis tyrosine autokinase [Lachnospiraceae bacterium]